jgi:hypothetical protein
MKNKMLKKRWMVISLSFIIYHLSFSPVGAQVKMSDVIKQMPDTLVPYLKQNALLDFIDFKDSGMKAEVSNDLGGKSQLVELSDDYTLFTLNAASQIQMRLLDVQEPVDSANQILCMVRTFGSDICESTIGFYSVRWRPLPLGQRIALPSYMHRIVLSAQAPELTVEQETGMDVPANEEQKKIEKTLISFKWDGKVFKMY